MALTIEDLRIIIKNYYPPKPDETNYLAFMGENFFPALFALFLKNGASSFKNLAAELTNIPLPIFGLTGAKKIPPNKGGIGGEPDTTYYDGSEQGDKRRSTTSTPPTSSEDKKRVSSSSRSQRQSDYNDVKNNPSYGNMYGTQYTKTPTYVYYDDLLRRLYMIDDYFFS